MANLDATLTKDAAVGVNLLSQPIQTAYGRTAMVEFPGGYIAEIHEVAK